VAISDDGVCIAIEEVKGFKHSSKLSPMILELLSNSGIKRKEIDAVAISKGPGSYTGLRVGASTAKGWAFGLDVPLIAINTLHTLASSIQNLSEGELIAPMIDARRNEVYTALFDSDLNKLKPTHSFILDNGISPLISDDNTKCTICGNGAFKAQPFESSLIKVVPSECSARYLTLLSYKSYLNAEFEALDHFEPFYLKPPNIAKPKSLL